MKLCLSNIIYQLLQALDTHTHALLSLISHDHNHEYITLVRICALYLFL